MFKAMLVTILLLLSLASSSSAQENAVAKIPPAAEAAAQALKDSPRHGEWVEIVIPGVETKVRSWVVYPERKERAPVLIVIHEIFGMTDWVRAVADQLAAEGYIAIAPDLLSGKGPDGGGTDSFAGDMARVAIADLKPKEIESRLNAVRDYAIALPAATGKSATIGFCWGGSTSFAYATRQRKLVGDCLLWHRAEGRDVTFQTQLPGARLVWWRRRTRDRDRRANRNCDASRRKILYASRVRKSRPRIPPTAIRQGWGEHECFKRRVG